MGHDDAICMASKNLASGCAQLDNVLVVERCVIYVAFARVSLLASVVDCREGHVAYVCMCVCVWREVEIL